MKKLSNLHKKVLNIAVTFLFIFALMIGNVVRVAAYTADTPITGYPYVLDNLKLRVGYLNSNGNTIFSDNISGVLADQNAYSFSNLSFANVASISVGNEDNSLVIPYDDDLYDYYLIGTIMADSSSNVDFNWIGMYSYTDGSGGLSVLEGSKWYEMDNYYGDGQSFSVKLDGLNNVNLSQIKFTDDYSDTVLNGTVWFSASIVPILKSGTEADTLNSILQTLNNINQNIITGNTLQQQTIDAINANTTNNTNWFSTLFSNLSTWYTGMTDNLRNWFYMIDGRLNTGFSNLYNQMTKEQDEKINGYQDTTQSDAAASFSSESDKLTSLEGELSTQGNDFVNDYTSDGFDTGVLTTLVSSLIFVATWFTNFWNMGGVFTATLNLCFALSIVFFIFRIKR